MEPLHRIISSLELTFRLTGNGRTLPSGQSFCLLAFNLDGLNSAITTFLKNDTFTDMLVEMDRANG